MRLANTYEFFIPIEEDGTGLVHSPELWDRWEAGTQHLFKGLSRLPGLVLGWWWDSDRNDRVVDYSRAYVLALPPRQEAVFLTHMQATCSTFCQKCLYVERRGEAALVGRDPNISIGNRVTIEDPDVDISIAVRGCLDVSDTAGQAVLTELKHRIINNAPYLDVLEFALGLKSPLLRGAAIATASIQYHPLYQQARELITRYGEHLGLLQRALSSDSSSIVAEPMSSYGRPPFACVSQLRAARLLGWNNDQIHNAIASGMLHTQYINGAIVIERSSIDALL